MLKSFCLLTISLLLLSTPTVAVAESQITQPPSNPILISEVYPDAVGSDSDDTNGEFIEIHNATDEIINLSDYGLSIRISPISSSRVYTIDLSAFSLAPGEFLAIRDTSENLVSFSLSNTGATVTLVQTIGALEFELQKLLYDSTGSDQYSWSLFGDTWDLGEPSPGEKNKQLPIDEPDEVPEEDVPTEETPVVVEEEEDLTDDDEATPSETICDISDVFINELVANPAGSDKLGGEFIELKNESSEMAPLEGCQIITDKGIVDLAGLQIPANGLIAINLFDDLLNGGGTVSLITAHDEYIVEYPPLGDNESWSLFDGGWELSKLATPESENQRTPEKEEAKNEATELKPCPEGKFRNPETNRCKNIVETASSLLPCAAGSVRNPETNRCRKISAVTASSSLKPCAKNQERNPETNRCRKIQTTTNQLKPCDEGQERNPETNRCRSVSKVLSGATIEPPAKEAGIHSAVFVVMTIIAITYGIYEYRLDFANMYNQIRAKFES